ncbi:hypothetical protein H1R20_g3333, partial [Candolleomyces eurysporus]
MDHMHAELMKSVKDENLNASLHSALTLGVDLLNKYYSLTDESEVYRIAIVLHPAYKFCYLKKAQWPEAWISTAEGIVCKEFQLVYADFQLKSNASRLVQLQKPAKCTSSLSSDDDMGAEAPSSTDSNSTDEEEMLSELDQYLKTKVVKDVTDPLGWWYENQGSYPQLWRMAQDYLTIPATSISVEQVFSQGCLILSHIQNQLSGQSTRALTCLGAWTKQNLVWNLDLLEASKLPDLGDDEEFVWEEYPVV